MEWLLLIIWLVLLIVLPIITIPFTTVALLIKGVPFFWVLASVAVMCLLAAAARDGGGGGDDSQLPPNLFWG